MNEKSLEGHTILGCQTCMTAVCKLWKNEEKETDNIKELTLNEGQLDFVIWALRDSDQKDWTKEQDWQYVKSKKFRVQVLDDNEGLVTITTW